MRAAPDVRSPATVDKRFINKSGKAVWVRRSAAVLRDDSGQARYVIGAFVDLTEQRQKDRALHQMNGFLGDNQSWWVCNMYLPCLGPPF